MTIKRARELLGEKGIILSDDEITTTVRDISIISEEILLLLHSKISLTNKAKNHNNGNT